MGRMRRIAVVGGGGGAVCLLDALSRTSAPPAAVTVFEPSDRLWRGRPYQRDADCILVNLPSRAMSVRSGDRDHFDRWLSRGHRWQPEATEDADPFNAAAFPLEHSSATTWSRWRTTAWTGSGTVAGASTSYANGWSTPPRRPQAPR